MLNEKQILAMAKTAEESPVLIVHIRTGNLYALIGRSKSKINGEWHDMVDYSMNFKIFSRTPDDFKGFSPSVS